MPDPSFQLDPRLAADTVFVTDLALCRVLLSRDGNYPWTILVPMRPGAVEIVDLDRDDRLALMDEIAMVSAALRDATRCHKLNVGALGNVVAQLHVHVIARFEGDLAWPGPIWGRHPAAPWDTTKRDAMVETLRAALGSAAA